MRRLEYTSVGEYRYIDRNHYRFNSEHNVGRVYVITLKMNEK
jgi:hypothetical protein